MTATLPHAYTLRAPRRADAEEITRLVQAAEVREQGESDFELEFLLEEWDEIDLETDAWVVVDADGAIAGYAGLGERGRVQLDAWAVTQPEHEGRGIGSRLLTLIEERAQQRIGEAPDGARVTLHNFIAQPNRAARELLERRGYSLVRRYWRMSIEMATAPDPPTWPAGIHVRTFEPGRDERATFDTMEESFSDHWGYIPGDFDKWVKQTQRDTFDPTLWFLAVDRDRTGDGPEEIAGASLCSNPAAIPWVNRLAVRRPWRRRGLGLALLRHSFGELWRRGCTKVALGVDSENLTGATRLYERAGMVADRQWDRYEKELRPGEELQVRAVRDN